MWGFINREPLGVAEQKDLSCNGTVGKERLGLFDCVSARYDGFFSTLKVPLFLFVLPRNSCGVSGLLGFFCVHSGDGGRLGQGWVHTTCWKTPSTIQ